MICSGPTPGPTRSAPGPTICHAAILEAVQSACRRCAQAVIIRNIFCMIVRNVSKCIGHMSTMDDRPKFSGRLNLLPFGEEGIGVTLMKDLKGLTST